MNEPREGEDHIPIPEAIVCKGTPRWSGAIDILMVPIFQKEVAPGDGECAFFIRSRLGNLDHRSNPECEDSVHEGGCALCACILAAFSSAVKSSCPWWQAGTAIPSFSTLNRGERWSSRGWPSWPAANGIASLSTRIIQARASQRLKPVLILVLHRRSSTTTTTI
jgi:hypothetical protein